MILWGRPRQADLTIPCTGHQLGSRGQRGRRRRRGRRRGRRRRRGRGRYRDRDHVARHAGQGSGRHDPRPHLEAGARRRHRHPQTGAGARDGGGEGGSALPPSPGDGSLEDYGPSDADRPKIHLDLGVGSGIDTAWGHDGQRLADHRNGTHLADVLGESTGARPRSGAGDPPRHLPGTSGSTSRDRVAAPGVGTPLLRASPCACAHAHLEHHLPARLPRGASREDDTLTDHWSRRKDHGCCTGARSSTHRSTHALQSGQGQTHRAREQIWCRRRGHRRWRCESRPGRQPVERRSHR